MTEEKLYLHGKPDEPITAVHVKLCDITKAKNTAKDSADQAYLVPIFEAEEHAIIATGRDHIRISKLQHWLMSRSFGIHSSILILIVLTACIVGLSFAFQTINTQTEWFARGGSLVVCAAVIFAFRDMKSDLEIKIQFVPKYRKFRRDIQTDVFYQQLNRDREQEHDDKFRETAKSLNEPDATFEAIHKSTLAAFSATAAVYAASERDLKTESAQTIRRLIRNTTLVEATIMILGTVIWGYGDLLMNCIGY